MILDNELLFSEKQTVTASAASTHIIDQGVGDAGAGMALMLFVNVDQAVTASGAATVQVQIQTSVDEAFTSPITVASTEAVGKAALLAGYQFSMPVPRGLNKRFIRLYYNVGTGPLTTGQFTAGFTTSIQDNKHYPDAL